MLYTLYQHAFLRLRTVPSIHLFPAISGRGEVENGECRRIVHSRIEIIREHKTQTEQLGEYISTPCICVVL